MAKAIGMVECTTVATGFKAADDMAKAADVEILQAEVTCPGKFVITSEGDISTCHTVGSRHDELYEEFVFGHIDANCGNVYINQEKLSKILSFGTKSNEECKDCPAHWHCAGGCYADSFHLTKKEHDAYCESMRLFLRQYLIYKFDL